MGETNRIASDFLEHLKLAFGCTQVEGCSKSAEIVVKADASNGNAAAVEMASIFCFKLDRADAECRF